MTVDDIILGACLIQRGGLVAFPTETVYGLGANALDPIALAKIFAAKKRPFFDPLIVHIADTHSLLPLVEEVPPIAKLLIQKFWPGPLTIIFKKKPIIPDLVTSGFNTVAIRMPDHPIALELIKKSGYPIAAPSANLFGRLSPTKACHVKKHLGDSVDLIINGGKCRRGLESTIIDVTQTPPVIYRAGALSLEEIEKIIGPIRLAPPSDDLVTPGSLAFHYAPRTKFILLKENEAFPVPKKGVGYLTFGPLDSFLKSAPNVEKLSLNSDLIQAASNLFECLHRLDDAGLDIIYAKPIVKEGLGIAIMDRLTKAANTFSKDS